MIYDEYVGGYFLRIRKNNSVLLDVGSIRCSAKVRKKFISLILGVSLLTLSNVALAFKCSIFEGRQGEIPSFTSEIAELNNLDKNGQHLKLLIPKQGAVVDFDLDEYLKEAKNKSEILSLLRKVQGASIVYIDLFSAEKRYEVRMGVLTDNLNKVIKQTVYANFSYNLEHNEVYDLQNDLAVFCN